LRLTYYRYILKHIQKNIEQYVYLLIRSIEALVQTSLPERFGGNSNQSKLRYIINFLTTATTRFRVPIMIDVLQYHAVAGQLDGNL